MNKLGFLSIFFMILLVSFVSALEVGTVDITDVTSPSGNPGDTVQVNVTVKNVGDVNNDTIQTLTLSSTSLTFGSNTITVPTIPSITNLVNSTSQTSSFSLTIPITLAGAYSATITAKESGNDANNDTFAYSVTVNSFNALDIQTYDNSSNPLTITGEERDTKTATIDIKNTGSTSFTLTSSLISFTSSDFADDDNDTIELTFSGFDSVSPGDKDTITLTAQFPRNIDLDTYSGIITIKHPNDNSVTDTFKLEVRVQPEVCEDGIVKDGDPTSSSQALLQIDIQEPDDGDEFKPGETIDLEINVQNDDDKEMDVIVEAFLYDLDDNDKIVSAESSSVEIDEDDDNDFDLQLEIPKDPDLDEDHEFTIFIKAYEDGDEDKNCNEDNVDIDIEKEDHDVVIDSIIVSPSTVSCGESIDVRFDVVNIGSRDEDDVFVELKNSALKLNLISNNFDLDEGDDITESFSFTIPLNIESKTYDLEIIVTFDDGDEEYGDFVDLVVECKEIFVLPEVTATLSVDEDEIVAKENSFSIPVKVTNNANEKFTYVLDVDANWANPVSPKTLTLNAGQSSTVFILLEAKEGETGRKSALIELKSDGRLVDSQSLVLELGEAARVGIDLSKLTESTAFWIVADIVAIVVVLYVLKLVFLPKKP